MARLPLLLVLALAGWLGVMPIVRCTSADGCAHVDALAAHDLDRLVRARGRHRAGGLLPRHGRPYILNTPNRVGGIGRLSEAEIASARTRRVSAGSITPSSHSRALA